MGTKTLEILIAEDDASLRHQLQELFESTGKYKTTGFGTVQETVNYIEQNHPNIAFLIADYELIGGTGMDILNSRNSIDPTLPMVLLSGKVSRSESNWMNRHGLTNTLEKSGL